MSPSLGGPVRDAQASLGEGWPGGGGAQTETDRTRIKVGNIQETSEDPLSVRETPGLAAHDTQDPAQGSQTQFSKIT